MGKRQAPPHPMQPLVVVEGVTRFRQNRIVRYLLDHGGITLNDLHRLDFDEDEHEQFAQLIGYSVSGFSELSYVSDAVYQKARRRELRMFAGARARK